MGMAMASDLDGMAQVADISMENRPICIDCKNHDIANLQTLCANCHRLKTALGKEWIGGKWKYLRRIA